MEGEDNATSKSLRPDSSSDSERSGSSNSDRSQIKESTTEETSEIGAVSNDAKLLKALSYKDRGNEAVKKNDFDEAKRLYQRGIKIVNEISGEQQADGLKVMLNLNLALSCTKLSQPSEAIKAADIVLEMQPGNVKALFRRGIARTAFGMLEEAKADLSEVLKVDPKNATARKELKAVKEKIVEHNKMDKAYYKGIFSKVGGGIYDDREKERIWKQEADAAQFLEDEKAWKQSNEDRVSVGMGAQTKEEWLNSKKDKLVTKNEPSKSSEIPMKSTSASKPIDKPKDTDDDHLDEEDLKIINETKKKGYCYFRRQLDEDEQALLDTEQKKLRESKTAAVSNENCLPASNFISQEDVNNMGTLVGSEWNAAGTWEEKDKTEWVKSRLQTLLMTVAVKTGHDFGQDPGALLREMSSALGMGKSVDSVGAVGAKLAQITAIIYKVDKIDGDASVVVVRGRKRTLFDFNITLKWRIQVDESLGLNRDQPNPEQPPKIYKGSYKLIDVTANDAEKGHFETPPELQFGKTRWPELYKERMAAIFDLLEKDIMTKFQMMYADFKQVL